MGYGRRGQEQEGAGLLEENYDGKVEGGLGFEPFQHQSLTLKMQWCGKLMEDVDVLWGTLAKESIARSLNSGLGVELSTIGLLQKGYCWIIIGWRAPATQRLGQWVVRGTTVVSV